MRRLGCGILVVAMVSGYSYCAEPANDSKPDSTSQTERPNRDARAFFQKLVGKWKGTYRLWMYPKKESEDSATTAEIRFVGADKFLLFTYTWVQGEKNQEGVFLLGGDKDVASATWGDSWHMAPQPMICEGVLEDDGNKLVLNGHYSAGPAKWGWRTELTLKDSGTLVMKAFNISPEGQEALAIQSEMERAAGKD